MLLRSTLRIVLVLALFQFTSIGVAQNFSAKVSAGNSNQEPRQIVQREAKFGNRLNINPGPINEAGEQAALDFARQHHPELEDVILRLKGMDQRQYLKVIRDLWRTSERLSGLKIRNAEQYEIQLELWKSNSKATLAAARVQLDPKNESLQIALEKALKQKLNSQKAALQFELERARLRVEKLEKSLKTLNANGSKNIQREMKRLTSSAK